MESRMSHPAGWLGTSHVTTPEHGVLPMSWQFQLSGPWKKLATDRAKGRLMAPPPFSLQLSTAASQALSASAADHLMVGSTDESVRFAWSHCTVCHSGFGGDGGGGGGGGGGFGRGAGLVQLLAGL